MSTSLTQQFAAEYAKGAVPAMLKAIKNSKWKTRLIMTGVFAVTYKHQADFLSADESIGELGWVIPGINDLAMLTMVEILQTPGMSRDAKRGAAWMLGLCGTLSATVNVAAPGTLLARAVFGLLVVIVVGLKLVTARIKPDFSELELREAEATAVVEQPARKLDPAVAAERAAKARATRERNAAAALTPAQKAARTRAANRAIDAELASMTAGSVPANAPVSPAV